MSPSTRASMSLTKSDCHARASKACLASGGVALALIKAMISSTLDKATAKPSKIWPRSRAFFNSNMVRRVTTSRRWRKNSLKICLTLSKRGWPSTKATILMPKLSCNCVILYNWLSTTSAFSLRLSSITTRMPDLSDSSRKSDTPSKIFSRTNSPIFSTNLALFTW